MLFAKHKNQFKRYEASADTEKEVILDENDDLWVEMRHQVNYLKLGTAQSQNGFYKSNYGLKIGLVAQEGCFVYLRKNITILCIYLKV
jgi:hypothetical protein